MCLRLPCDLIGPQARFYGLSNKVPDIKKAVDAVELLIAKRDDPEPITIDFELADNVYAKVLRADPGCVLGALPLSFLWLLFLTATHRCASPPGYQAKLQGVKSVNLWLGANCMLEYPLDEAHVRFIRIKLPSCSWIHPSVRPPHPSSPRVLPSRLASLPVAPQHCAGDLVPKPRPGLRCVLGDSAAREPSTVLGESWGGSRIAATCISFSRP